MAKHVNVPHCHVQHVPQKLKSFTICIAKVFRCHRPKLLRLNHQEQFVKVPYLEIAKTAQKLHSKFIMADFLLDLRLFSMSADVISAYQISSTSSKGKGFDFENCWGVLLSQFDTPNHETQMRCQFSPLLMHVQSFVSL